MTQAHMMQRALIHVPTAPPYQKYPKSMFQWKQLNPNAYASCLWFHTHSQQVGGGGGGSSSVDADIFLTRSIWTERQTDGI